MDVLQIAFGRFHFLAQQLQLFQRIVQPLAAFAQPVLDQDVAILGFKLIVIQFFGIHLNRAGAFFIHQLLEQILVIHDKTEFFVFAIQPVDAADGLEQAMILHRFIDIQIGATGRIETGQQFIDHDQQLHICRLVDKQPFCLIFVSFGLGFARFGADIFQQGVIGVIDHLFVRLGIRAGFFGGDVPGLRIVRSDDRAFTFQFGCLEQLVVPASLENARCHQNGVAHLRA